MSSLFALLWAPVFDPLGCVVSGPASAQLRHSDDCCVHDNSCSLHHLLTCALIGLSRFVVLQSQRSNWGPLFLPRRGAVCVVQFTSFRPFNFGAGASGGDSGLGPADFAGAYYLSLSSAVFVCQARCFVV